MLCLLLLVNSVACSKPSLSPDAVYSTVRTLAIAGPIKLSKLQTLVGFPIPANGDSYSARGDHHGKNADNSGLFTIADIRGLNDSYASRDSRSGNYSIFLILDINPAICITKDKFERNFGSGVEQGLDRLDSPAIGFMTEYNIERIRVVADYNLSNGCANRLSFEPLTLVNDTNN